MISQEVEVRAQSFFDDFVEAFRSFSGDKIAERYLPPCLVFHTPTAIQVFVSKAEIAGYFQRIVDEYHAKGCRSCRYKDIEVTSLGSACALGTVTWELLAEDLSVINAWRESYNLCFADGRFMVFASTDHAA